VIRRWVSFVIAAMFLLGLTGQAFASVGSFNSGVLAIAGKSPQLKAHQKALQTQGVNLDTNQVMMRHIGAIAGYSDVFEVDYRFHNRSEMGAVRLFVDSVTNQVVKEFRESVSLADLTAKAKAQTKPATFTVTDTSGRVLVTNGAQLQARTKNAVTPSSAITTCEWVGIAHCAWECSLWSWIAGPEVGGVVGLVCGIACGVLWAWVCP
jgi:hypothetical protein